jgi:hypothetical protein
MLGGMFSRFGLVAGCVLGLIVGFASGEAWAGLATLAGAWGIGIILSWILRAPNL